MPLTVRRWRSSETADQPTENLFFKKKHHVFNLSPPVIAGSVAMKGRWRTGREMAGQVLPLEAGRSPGIWHGAVPGMSLVLQVIPVWTVLSQSDPRPDFQFASIQLLSLTPKPYIWRVVGAWATQETHVVPIWVWDSRVLFSCEVIADNFSDTDGHLVHEAHWDLLMRSLLYRVGIHIIINQGLAFYHLVLILSLASRWQQAVQMGSLPPTTVFWAPVPGSVNLEKIPPELCLQPCLIHSVHLRVWNGSGIRDGIQLTSLCMAPVQISASELIVTGSSFSQWTETSTFKTWFICSGLDAKSRMNCVLVSISQTV